MTPPLGRRMGGSKTNRPPAATPGEAFPGAEVRSHRPATPSLAGLAPDPDRPVLDKPTTCPSTVWVPTSSELLPDRIAWTNWVEVPTDVADQYDARLWR